MIAIAGLVCFLAFAVNALARTGTLELLFQFPGVPDNNDRPSELDRGLIASDDGTLYGTTPGGGEFGAGAIFTIGGDGRFVVRHSFADRSTVIGGLAASESGTLFGVVQAGDRAKSAVIVSLDAAGTLRRLSSFEHYPAGGQLVAGLTLASDDSLYGVTAGAGTAGSVFRLDVEGRLEVRHAFRSDGTEGANPVGRLLEAADGNFYGVTSAGGAHFAGTIFRLTPAGKISVVHSFDPSTEGRDPNGGLTIEPGGGLYGTLCASSTSTANGLIYSLDFGGGFTVVHEFTGGEGACPTGAVIPIVDKGSDAPIVMGLMRQGGPNNGGTLYEFNKRSRTISVLEAFDGASHLRPADIALGQDGAVYGVTPGSASTPGMVFRVRLVR